MLAGVSRATVYAQRKRRPMNQTDVLLKHLMNEEYTHTRSMAAASWWRI